MANTASDIKSEIKSLLSGALPGENLNDFEIEIVGTTEKGDGFTGDIFFVNLTSTNKNYSLALKRSTASDAVRTTAPVQRTFEHEIYIYNTVFPAFRKFETERKIDDVFDSVAKCFGTFTCPGAEVIVLQNLKTLGYELWDKKLPLPRDYLETILKQYGKWHAISAAMQDQEPEILENLVSNLIDVWDEFCSTTSFDDAIVSGIRSILKICETEIEEAVLNEWKQFIDHIEFYIKNLRKKSKSFNVLTHGDCWNNNFMFKVTGDEEKSKKIEVRMLDWQVAGFSSPVIDLSYFLYTCISEEDLKDFDDLLMIYYESFAENVRKLGSHPEKIYTYSSLLDDWKIYGRKGILLVGLIFPLIDAEGDAIPDMEKAAENGEDAMANFSTIIKDVDWVKRRSKCLLQHAVERDFIKPIQD